MIRLIGYFFGIATFLGLLVAGVVGIYIGHLTKDLPDYEVLARYEPPVTTRIHASDGSLMASWRERRPICHRSGGARSRQAAFCRPRTRISTATPASTSPASAALITNFRT